VVRARPHGRYLAHREPWSSDAKTGAVRVAGIANGSSEGRPQSLVIRAPRVLTRSRTAIAVLERDPAAVTALRAELERRRDRAAAELRFEFAAKLQDEIAAFEWIVADQKESWLEPHDADVYGWADGVLLRFEVRAGRMSTWTQTCHLRGGRTRPGGSDSLALAGVRTTQRRTRRPAAARLVS